jgi:transposase InsO family protein
LKVIGVCELAGMTPQNYYARRRTWHRQEVDVQLLLELARAERAQQPRLGVRKLYHLIGVELKAAGVKMGRDRFFEELKKAGLLVERKPSAWPKTTNFNPALPVFKNLSKGRPVSGSNQVWVADITYIRTWEAFMFLSLITDRWSRKIVGFHLAETLESEGTLVALTMALKSLSKGERPIHHSDRGCQYASHRYVKRVERAGLRMSMTEKNHGAENALAERVNGILKQEYWMDESFQTKPQARRAAAEGIYLYNHRRPHTALGFRTPAMVHDAVPNK